MTPAAIPSRVAKTSLSSAEYHEKAAMHHYQAAEHHHNAAKHHEAGNHIKAWESALKAYWYHCLAGEVEQAVVKLHR